MLAQPRSEQDDFLKQTTEWYSAIGLQDDLKRLRAKAWDRYLEVGLPTLRSELFRYVRLRQLFGQDLQPAPKSSLTHEELDAYLYPECQKAALVFVNGHYSPELSRTQGLPESMVVAPLHEAMRQYGSFLQNQWAQLTKEEADPFALLNGALHPAGVFIYIPPKTRVEQPVQVLHIVDSSAQGCIVSPRLHLFAGREAELTLCYRTVEKESHGYFLNHVFDVALDEAAHVKCLFELMGQSPDVWHMHAIRGSIKRNASLHTTSLTDGARAVRCDYKAALLGEGADVSLNGLWMLDDRHEAHQNILIDHQAPHCHSNQYFKGVLTDVARSSFEGKILVRKEAQKTEAYQLNNNLVLSDKAHADCKPNLEIFADDVKASHGATIGQLEQEELFYLKTRGVEKEQARNMLISGFCKEVIDLVPLPSVKNRHVERSGSFLA